MPSEAEQQNLKQPWKGWADKLDANRSSTSAIVCSNKDDDEGNGTGPGKSTHGTVALYPRADVNLGQEKERPVR
jgi:hypothetical protein